MPGHRRAGHRRQRSLRVVEDAVAAVARTRTHALGSSARALFRKNDAAYHAVGGGGGGGGGHRSVLQVVGVYIGDAHMRHRCRQSGLHIFPVLTDDDHTRHRGHRTRLNNHCWAIDEELAVRRTHWHRVDQMRADDDGV